MRKLLLHSCCGPCSGAVIERLLPEYEIRVFYYNPNISDEEEYLRRLNEQERLLSEAFPGVSLIKGNYEHESFLNAVKGFEHEPEGGARCDICFKLRLFETAKKAKEMGFDFFDTTLSVSPHKNFEKICAAGRFSEEKYGVSYLGGNYKKKDGFKRSLEISKKHLLYRQNYCGCEFSKRPGK